MKQPHAYSRLLVIGGIGITALVACPGPDSTPDAFSFSNKTGLSITDTNNVESEPVSIEGMTSAASISVTGGLYGIDGAACQTNPGTITVGQKLRLCAPRPKKFGEETSVSIDVGGTKASFKAVAENLETLNFAATSFDTNGKAESAANTPAWTSNLTDLDVSFKSVTGVTGATGGFKIGTGSCQITAAKVKKTDSIRACSSVPGGTVNGAKAIVTLEFGSATTGLITKTFEASVGAVVADNIQFSQANFTPVLTIAPNTPAESDEITVTGIGSSAPITITPASATLYVDGLVKANTSSITNGQKIRVRQTSSATADTSSTVTVKVGTTSTVTYTIRTAGALAADEFATVEALTDYRPATGENAPTNGFVVPDTTPTCKYGTGTYPGPWRKASAAEIAVGDIDMFYRAGYEFKKSGVAKPGWNNCPENWDEAAILAAGDAGQNLNGEVRKFGKTTLNFNVAGTGNVTKVELKLKLAHQSRADLLMTLVSPNGTRILIYDMQKDSQNKTIRGSQFSNPNTYNEWKKDINGNKIPNSWRDGENLFESTGISIIFDDAAVPPPNDAPVPNDATRNWIPDGEESATLKYRCGQNDRPVGDIRRIGNSLGACWNNGNTDNKANFPGITGFGSFARVRPSNPLTGFIGLAATGTWKLEIEDRASGNQESNDDAFPPFRPLAGQTGFTNSAGVLISGLTGVADDTKDLVRQPALAQGNIPRVRVATLTVK